MQWSKHTCTREHSKFLSPVLKQFSCGYEQNRIVPLEEKCPLKTMLKTTDQYLLHFHFFLFETLRNHMERTCKCESVKILVKIPTGKTETREIHNSN